MPINELKEMYIDKFETLDYSSGFQIVLFILLFLFLYLLINMYIRSKSLVYTIIGNNKDRPLNLNPNDIYPPDIPHHAFHAYNPEMEFYCCYLIYCVHKKILAKHIDLVYSFNLDHGAMHNTNIYTHRNKFGENVMYIAFRGSININDWFYDMNINQSLIQETNEHDQYFIGKHIKIHEGFLQYYARYSNIIIEIIKKENPSYIVTCGHSLGGPLSVLASLDAYLNNFKNTVNYNFACPRIGNDYFKNTIQDKFNVYRRVNNSDVVPSIPTSVYPNKKDFDNPFIYTHLGQVRVFDFNYGSLKSNHSIQNYFYNMVTLLK